MRYFELSLRGNTDNPALAFVREAPASLGLYAGWLRRGERIGAHYPNSARFRLDKRARGTEVQALLGNTLSYLMLTSAARDVFLRVCTCEIEVLPFVLLDSQGRIHSKDLSILNPIGTHDCVNRTASKIQYSKTDPGKIIGIGLVPGSLVLDPAKLEKAPDLFRVPEEPARLFMSELLAKACKQHGLDQRNVLLKEEMQVKRASARGLR